MSSVTDLNDEQQVDLIDVENEEADSVQVVEALNLATAATNKQTEAATKQFELDGIKLGLSIAAEGTELHDSFMIRFYDLMNVPISMRLARFRNQGGGDAASNNLK